MTLQDLAARLTASGVIQDVEADDTFVFGTSHFPADGSDITVNVDPEFEENPDVDLAALVANVGRILEIRGADWQAILDTVVSEVEEAMAEVDLAPVVSLREDMSLDSLVVLIDAYLVAFVSPGQFPDGLIQVQLDEDFDVLDLAIDLDGEDDEED